MRRLSLLSLLLVSAPVAASEDPVFSADRVKADISFLADDLTEGRAPGTRGYDIAALFVAQRFAALGLEPGNAGGWYQSVPFAVSKFDPARPSSLTIGEESFANLEHVIISPTSVDASIAGTAPVVFVGYGLEDRSLGLDDYRGLDVRGKIVAFLWGTPDGLPSEVAATLNSKKAERAVEKGAIGTLTIVTPVLSKIFPWDKVIENAVLPKMRWVHPDGRVEDPTGPLRFSAMLDPTAARALFEGSALAGARFDAMLADPKSRPKGMALPAKVRIARNSLVERITSPNVVAILPGSDPKLSSEVILLSAHLDHLGIKDGGSGDRIYNGAIDNASGVATMLEVAHAFATNKDRPRRTIAFVALTAEEKGLLGSEYLAKYPLPQGRRIVADVNLDGPMLTSDFSDVIAYGAEHSTIGKAIDRAAKALDITLSPDPYPEQNFFVRSDHYSFVKEGVPGISFATGLAGGGKAANEAYEAGHYHRVSDDLSQPFVWSAGAKFAKLNYLIARDLADAPDAPRWYSGNYFGERFAPKAEKAPR